MASKLPPLDFTEDVEKYEAFADKKDVFLLKCDHKAARVVGQELRCICGASWMGPNLHVLEKLMRGK